MNTAQINALVRPAYDRLETLNNITFTAYRDKMRDMCEAEERQHRKGKPDCVTLPRGATVDAAAKFFVVQRIAQYMVLPIAQYMRGDREPSIADFIHMQRSVFYAASLVANYREQIAKAWSDQDIVGLALLDYCELVRSKRP